MRFLVSQRSLYGSVEEISNSGDPLELIERHIVFEAFRPTLEAALDYGDRPKGGRPP